MELPARIPIPDEVIALARRLEEAGHEAWCVGGAVRDTLLGDMQKDFDLATSATPEQVQALFKRTVAVGVKYGTVGVFDSERVLHEVTTFRHDVRTDGRHAEVAYGVSLDEDLARRDFTVNAIAYHPLRGEWRDLFGGVQDLERRRLRAVGDPSARFREDYLRVLRALRFAARLDFAIDPETWEAACAAAGGLSQLSSERVRDEWVKGLATTRSPSKTPTVPYLTPTATVRLKSRCTCSGVAEVARSKSFCSPPSSESRTAPPTHHASWPASSRRRAIAITSSGMGMRAGSTIRPPSRRRTAIRRNGSRPVPSTPATVRAGRRRWHRPAGAARRPPRTRRSAEPLP